MPFKAASAIAQAETNDSGSFVLFVVAQIDAHLSRIRHEHRVSILLAIESGSRAWGFPSPDSDYDCRFIYARRANSYLSLWPEREVIELPANGILDINGWDLGKAIKLLSKGNAVVIEWLTSPISYATDPQFRREFLDLSRNIANRGLIGRHYLHLGERQRRTYFRNGKPIQQKKIFYAFRPAAALRWLRHHPQEVVAPMHLPTLLAECAPPVEVSEIVNGLMARKASTRELGEELLAEPIRKFVDEEFACARAMFETKQLSLSSEARASCNDFFRSTLRRIEKTGRFHSDP